MNLDFESSFADSFQIALKVPMGVDVSRFDKCLYRLKKFLRIFPRSRKTGIYWIQVYWNKLTWNKEIILDREFVLFLKFTY